MGINKRKRSAITRPMNRLRKVVDEGCRNPECPYFLEESDKPVMPNLTCRCLEESKEILGQLGIEIGRI